MQFVNPIMLSTLALIPVIIIIHALKPRPRQVEVTNLFLWQAVLKERSRSLTLEQFKRNLPLLLQIFIIILAALALARPVWLVLTPQRGDMIIIVDTSASMKTSAGSVTRFDLARKKALELISQRRDSQKILLIEAGAEPVVKTGFSESSKQVKKLIKSLGPAEAPGNLSKAIYLALSFVDRSREDTIFLISDFAGNDYSALLENHPNITPIVISGGERNIGITRFEFRREMDRKNNYEIMLEVKNFNLKPSVCPLRLSIDNTTIFKTALTFAAEEKKLLVIPYSGLITGIAEAVLDIDDDFAIDNTAWLSLNTAKDIWVLLVSKGNYFLEKILKAYPNVMVNSVNQIIPSSWKEQIARHDLVIVDRMDFPLTDKGNFLLIDAYSPSIPVLKAGQIDFPKIIDWDKESPLMADVNVEDLTVERAAVLKVDKAMRALIESYETGLMYRYEEEGFRAVLMGFDITRSDLPLRIAFPVLMSNIFNWLNPHQLDISTMKTKAGKPFNIYLKPETKNFKIRAPHQKWEKHAVVSNPYKYQNTQNVGIYTISENNKWRYFAVNLVDESESNIKISSPQTFSRESGEAFASEKIAVQQPLWPYFIMLVLAVLIIEWYFWLKIG